VALVDYNQSENDDEPRPSLDKTLALIIMAPCILFWAAVAVLVTKAL
jgi:hypothetical protein